MKIWQATTSPTPKIPLPFKSCSSLLTRIQGSPSVLSPTVFSSFLQHLAQLILLIIAPHDTDDAPPFLHHPEIYNLEFWHAHLNYACTRFATSHGSDRLLGNQICHWTMGTAETCMKVTHLVIFLSPALGAYVLFQHSTKVSSSLGAADDASMQDEPHTLHINQSSLLTPPAVVPHQAEQIANARRRAAEGSLAPYTISTTSHSFSSKKNKVSNTLVVEKATLPKGSGAKIAPLPCENHVRELRTFFTVVLEPNIHTFSVLSETLPDFLKSKLC